MKIRREVGRFQQPGAAQDARSSEEIQEIRASIALGTTIYKVAAIWSIVWMLDNSIIPINLDNMVLAIEKKTSPCIGSPVGLLTFIRTINFALGGFDIGEQQWRGAVSDFERVLQTLEDELRILVGGVTAEN